jgi:hypothetical protein
MVELTGRIAEEQLHLRPWRVCYFSTFVIVPESNDEVKQRSTLQCAPPGAARTSRWSGRTNRHSPAGFVNPSFINYLMFSEAPKTQLPVVLWRKIMDNTGEGRTAIAGSANLVREDQAGKG